MAKVLDFNALERPVLELVMADENKTKIHVTTPTEELVEKLEAAMPELEPALKAGSREHIKLFFELAADLMSCNQECLTLSADDLRDKYRMKLDGLVVFFVAYQDFINEIANAKN